MFNRYTLLSIILILIFSLSFASAQEGIPRLRDLADANDLYLGAAAWTQHLTDPNHSEILGQEFNMLVPEHQAKFCMIQERQGVYDFRAFDRLVAFAEENDMVVRGHTLIWHSCEPAWLSSGNFSREEAINIMRDYIYTVVGRYKGRIPIWDVVNEAIDGSDYRDTPLYRMIGEDYIELAFQFAHDVDPDALLFYNDYGAEGMNNKAHTIYNMVSDFIERGVPIDGVGLQMHLTVGDTEDGSWLRPANLNQNMQRITDLGLEVQVTEMDVRHDGVGDEETFLRQAADYQRVLEVCLDNESCTAFIVWGVSDNFSWIRDWSGGNPEAKPLLFTDDYEHKPAYYAIASLLAERAGLPPVSTDFKLNRDSGEAEADVIETIQIPEPSWTDPAQLAPDPVDGIIYYAPNAVTIILDGDTSDWDNIPRVTVDSGPSLPSDNDTVFTFAVAADETSLYFLAEVQDSQIVYDIEEAGSEWYLEDSVEFYLNTTGDLTTSAYQSGIAQMGISSANLESADQLIISGGNSGDSEISLIAVQTETGYLIEASVPLETEVWSISPEHMTVLGFQAHLNGSSGNDRDTKLIWSINDPDDQSWTNPANFGQLMLWDSTQ